MATVKDAKNNLTTYQYDGHDRRLKTLFPSKTTAGVSSTRITSSYDANGNLVSLGEAERPKRDPGLRRPQPALSRAYPTTADNVSYARSAGPGRANLTGYAITYAFDNAGGSPTTAARR